MHCQMYAEELDRYTHWGLLMGCEPEPSQPARQLATAITNSLPLKYN